MTPVAELPPERLTITTLLGSTKLVSPCTVYEGMEAFPAVNKMRPLLLAVPTVIDVVDPEPSVSVPTKPSKAVTRMRPWTRRADPPLTTLAVARVFVAMMPSAKGLSFSP